jgi:lipooligosaccharide transport system ATP-binding protein
VTSNQKDNVVRVEGLSKRFDEHTVVDGVSFSVRRGECLGLLGPNGAGKTTLLRMVLGTAIPSAGNLEVLGRPVPAQAGAVRAQIGVVPQLDNLDPDFSVVENLYIYGRYFGLSRRHLQAQVPVLLEFASLSERGDAKIGDLSGGMKRRLTLARALINDPQLLILDEPTTGLDPQARQLIWRRLRQLLSQGKTLIITTHYMEEAERLCDRVMVMDKGRILATGSPVELIRAHIEPQVIEVFGATAEQWLARQNVLAQRVEHVGETVFCYAQDERPLLQSLSQESGLRFSHRPANLEDVFLKLTGRDLGAAA